MKNNETEERRQQLRVWLSRDGMTRKDLAVALGVSEASAYGWLSCTNIPDKRWKQIKDFFDNKETPERKRIIGTTLSDTEMERAEEALKKAGIQMEELLRESLFEKIKSLLGE
jgi:transposase